MGKLDGKVAIITGGNSGIGLATALLFAGEGARLVLAARDSGRGRQAVEQVTAAGGEALFIPFDVRRPDDCRQVVEQTMTAYYRLDILFNNAGMIYVDKTVIDTSEEEWDTIIDVNLKGTFLMSKFAIPHMAAGGGGAIVNNASVIGLVGGGGVAAYCAAKGAVVLLTRAMALDHAAQQIRVNCVCPGSVDTPMLRKEMEDLGGIEIMEPAFAARHPMNRISSPEEVAKAVLYLASEDSSFVTGTALAVDGGRSAW
jgi:NAD(P)-dependent dehydrogenase (short-subunit alcohol dehydrogenase family)